MRRGLCGVWRLCCYSLSSFSSARVISRSMIGFLSVSGSRGAPDFRSPPRIHSRQWIQFPQFIGFHWENGGETTTRVKRRRASESLGSLCAYRSRRAIAAGILNASKLVIKPPSGSVKFEIKRCRVPGPQPISAVFERKGARVYCNTCRAHHFVR
jgi:hypothetical protein